MNMNEEFENFCYRHNLSTEKHSMVNFCGDVARIADEFVAGESKAAFMVWVDAWNAAIASIFEPDWDNAPEWAEWFAVDFGSSCYFYNSKPILNEDFIWWHAADADFASVETVDIAHMKGSLENMERTLQKRPESHRKQKVEKPMLMKNKEGFIWVRHPEDISGLAESAPLTDEEIDQLKQGL